MSSDSKNWLNRYRWPLALAAAAYARVNAAEEADRAYGKYLELGRSADPDFEREVGLPLR